MTGHIMTISGNGQVSIPAEVRARWLDDPRYVPGKAMVVDLGDRIVVAPVLHEPVAALRGKYAGRGPSTDRMRAQAHKEDAEADARAAAEPARRTPRRRSSA